MEISGTGKTLLTVDLVAERDAERELRDNLHLEPDHLVFLGEEQLSIRQEDLTKEEKLVVLVDMVDGTDLLERGLSNWCSAMVFFDPQGKRGDKTIAELTAVTVRAQIVGTADLHRAHHGQHRLAA
jgi:fructose-1,6-bisphosphatase/inositol monophosphatase family enzyme